MFTHRLAIFWKQCSEVIRTTNFVISGAHRYSMAFTIDVATNLSWRYHALFDSYRCTWSSWRALNDWMEAMLVFRGQSYIRHALGMTTKEDGCNAKFHRAAPHSLYWRWSTARFGGDETQNDYWNGRRNHKRKSVTSLFTDDMKHVTKASD